MELASIIINAGIFVATVIAAVIAHRSVVDSQDARDAAAISEEKAELARKEAVAAAERSASASERSATALERQVEIAEAAARTPSWTVTEAHHTARRWRFENTSGERLTGVSVILSEPRMWTIQHGIPDPIAAGQSFFVAGTTYMSVRTSIRLEWVDSAGVSHTDDFSIS